MKKIFLVVCFLLLTAMGPGSHMDDHKRQMSPFDIDKLENSKAPDFSLEDMDGNTITLASFKGKVVLLNFWATWCPPCKDEMFTFNRLYKDMKSHGLEIVAISADKSINDVKKYLSKNNFDFLFLWDGESITLEKYKVFSMPTTFLIDRNGIIVKKFIGEYNWTDPDIRKQIEKL